MNNNSKITITINDNRLKKGFLRLLSVSTLCLLPIGIGILMDSAAMQWLGFIFALLSVISFAIKSSRDCTFTSIEDAKAFLEKLKSGAA